MPSKDECSKISKKVAISWVYETILKSVNVIVKPMETLFDEYKCGTAYDEMIDSRGDPRPYSFSLYNVLSSLSPEEFEERCMERDRSFFDRGITFSLSGEERPFPLDPIPRIISGSEWSKIEAGVKQRVQVLEMFLNDIYTRCEVIKDGILPRALIVNSKLYRREAFGITTPNRIRIPVAGVDIIRDQYGTFRVLEDNVRIPSGVSYVIENRRAMTRIFPELLSSHHIRPVSDYPDHLLEALRASAPRNAGSNPVVVVLTPGVFNSAYFEHSFLARQMGVQLVEGSDLNCRNNNVYMRTTHGEQKVDVIYRRVDDEFLDPLFFRPDSLLGCAGLVNCARAGNVTITSAIGNGIADDKLTYTYVPDLTEYYLNEKPILPNVPTFRLEDPDQLKTVLGRLDQLVVKPVDASGGYGLVVGSHATDKELEEIAKSITANPRSFIAQEIIDLSTSPTKIGNRLEPRHIDLRPFAVNDGNNITVLPGGLTRVALPKGSLVVNSSQGGGSKDTWIITNEIETIDFVEDLIGENQSRGDNLEPSFPNLDQAPSIYAGNSLAKLMLSQQQQQQQQQAQGLEPGSTRCGLSFGGGYKSCFHE